MTLFALVQQPLAPLKQQMVRSFRYALNQESWWVANYKAVFGKPKGLPEMPLSVALKRFGLSLQQFNNVLFEAFMKDLRLVFLLLTHCDEILLTWYNSSIKMALLLSLVFVEPVVWNQWVVETGNRHSWMFMLSIHGFNCLETGNFAYRSFTSTGVHRYYFLFISRLSPLYPWRSVLEGFFFFFCNLLFYSFLQNNIHAPTGHTTHNTGRIWVLNKDDRISMNIICLHRHMYPHPYLSRRLSQFTHSTRV